MARRRGRSAADEPAEATVELAVETVRRNGLTEDAYEPVTICTNHGNVQARYYAAVEKATAGAIFVGGAGGGWDTPVRGWLYPRLCDELSGQDGIAALRVKYRHSADLLESTLDVLAGIMFLESEGIDRIALIGHSFGGAVVIQAAALSPAVVTCLPLSTQSYGAGPASDLAPRCSIFLAHGEADEVLPADCSRHVYDLAGEPRQIHLHPTARHGLDEWSDELPRLIRDWLREELTA